MQATNSRLVLAPSDLNYYVECAHLTTLALEVTRGARQRPYVPDDHGGSIVYLAEPDVFDG